MELLFLLFWHQSLLLWKLFCHFTNIGSFPKVQKLQPSLIWESNLAKGCHSIPYRLYLSHLWLWVFWPHEEGFCHTKVYFFLKKKRNSPKSISIGLVSSQPSRGCMVPHRPPKKQAPAKDLSSLLLSLGEGVFEMFQSSLVTQKHFIDP